VLMGSAVAKVIHPIIDREFRAAASRYRGGFQTQAKSLAGDKTSKEKNDRIEKLRADVQALRKRGDGLKKEMIVKVGDPALVELRELTRLESKDILSSSEALAKARADLLELAGQRAACIDALLLIDLEAYGTEELEAEEKEIAATALSIDRDARKILEQNKKLAEEVEPAEAAGVLDLNEFMIPIGLQPCLIDPKLCAASRDHSKDMEEKGFFAHESPVPGKKTPWDRAKNFGTKANSENIFVGSTSGKAANRGWWHSPGHHVNMLAPGARFVGMGVHGKHWTQMFRS
ncbi:MAG: CAP domain-containing protein, partial [Verrucomicrobiales bacterium]